jgi:hypothetical protein
MRELDALGVDAIVTDRPDLLRRILAHGDYVELTGARGHKRGDRRGGPGYRPRIGATHANIVEEAQRLLARADAAGVPLRVVGGVAVLLRAPNGLPAELTRSYRDVDFVTAKRAAGEVSTLLRGEGYTPHVAFNALHGRERLLFFDEVRDRQVDVFVGSFSMSHTIPIGDRLELEPLTVPLAELLLTKLQIVELNEKDVRDTLALLLTHPLGDADGDCVNGAQVARLCASDWGLWRTITANLAACRARLPGYELAPDERERIVDRFDELLERIEHEPKSRGWRLRARVGERRRWYELPEEIGEGPAG